MHACPCIVHIYFLLFLTWCSAPIHQYVINVMVLRAAQIIAAVLAGTVWAKAAWLVFVAFNGDINDPFHVFLSCAVLRD